MFQLPSAKPHDMGIPADAIVKTLQILEDKCWGLHSFIVVRHGHTVAEKWVSPYAPERPHLLHSLTKSFTSIATGFAVKEGLCGIDDLIVDHFADKLDSEPCENMRKMRIRHLLSMSTGHTQEPELRADEDSTAIFLKSFVEREPGSHFLYNTAASQLLGVLIEKLSGQSLDDYLSSRLFEPLGFGSYYWQRSSEGNCLGGYGLSLQSRDVAKFGQFLLQKGRWGGKRIIDESWIEEATSEHIRQEDMQGKGFHKDWLSGYGFQFWRCSLPDVYRADGMFGQFCLVFPNEDMVVAVTGGSAHMHEALDVIYEELLPALTSQPLPYDEEAQARLNDLAFSIPLPQGKESSPVSKELNGVIYRLHNGDRLCLNADDTQTLHWRRGGEARVMPLSYGAWAQTGVHDPQNPNAEYLCSAAWHSDERLLLTAVYHNTPTIATYNLHFIDRALHIREKKNADSVSTETEYFGIREDLL